MKTTVLVAVWLQCRSHQMIMEFDFFFEALNPAAPAAHKPIGHRRPIPKAFLVTLIAGGACLRFHSEALIS